MTGIQDPCPKWCVTEREPEDSAHIHRTQRTEVDRYAAGTPASISTRGGSFGVGDPSRQNEVVVHSWYQPEPGNSVNGDLYVPLKDAPHLAGVFEALSYVTPTQIRELAAGIRQAEAEMTEPEAGQ
jgi:hypothetical protein